MKKSNRAHLDDVLLALAGRDEGSDAALVQHRQSQSDSLRRRLRAVTDRSNQKILKVGSAIGESGKEKIQEQISSVKRNVTE